MARSKDIAEALGVSKPSVTGALQVLSRKGLVNYKPYGFVTLTNKGYIKASSIARKHDVITKFLVDILGVDLSTAQQAACKVEHTLGPKIISRLTSFTDFLQSADGQIAEKFKSDYKGQLNDN